MIVCHSEDVAVATLPNIEMKGKLLTDVEDGMGFSAYQVVAEEGETLKLRSSDSGDLDHIYYCISGTGDVKASNGCHYKLKPDCVVAFSSSVSAELIVETRIRLYVLYCDDINPSSERSVVKSLDEIVGTERDVDFKRGHSRRFLLKVDGFAITITSTAVMFTGDDPTKLEYRNHAESAYYISGKVSYSWNEGANKIEARITPDDGTVYNMNAHDKHMVSVHEDCIALCVFYPALRGNENHTYDGGYSCYDA
ncbi:L-ectoine synthase-like [Saccoglossus kowalevskii]|uniref:L-ectoine synthase n=1 Tax=Saccoglossus kowalevskii TaxID=10224 RepID=A0ABM0GGU9_SACKO|nr:L-ectoine synthase-like [Saccoglossus kowalevskii]